VETEIEDQFFAAGETRKPYFFSLTTGGQEYRRDWMVGKEGGLTPLFMNQSIGRASPRVCQNSLGKYHDLATC
jgi:hypothetical protein